MTGFAPGFILANAITAGRTAIEKSRGFLAAAALSCVMCLGELPGGPVACVRAAV